MSKNILTVTVNPAVDVTVPPAGAHRHLRVRGSTNSSGVVLSAGGKGVNVARVLRRLGVPTLAVGLAGGETGDFLQKTLRKENIPADFVPVSGSTRLNVTVLGPRPGHSQRFLAAGARVTVKEVREFERQYRRWLRRSRLVVLCGRNALGAPADWYARLVRLARREGVPAAVDTSGPPLYAVVKAGPFLIKPNREEAEEVLERRIGSRTEIKSALRRFHALGVCNVLLSLGGRGAVISNGREIFYARPPQVRVVNDVGCGDTALAGFIQAHGAGEPLAQALRWAVSCGTADALNPTPGVIRRKDVLRIMKKVTVKNWGALRQ